MKAEFNNTVSILVKAFLEGTLLKGDCHACAVGNICAAAMKIPLVIDPTPSLSIRAEASWGDGSLEACWQSHFMTDSIGDQWQAQTIGGAKDMGFDERDLDAGKRQMAATGYSIPQLARIELAFETAMVGVYSEEAEFAGLMAVVDVLADIHGVDLATAEVAKGLFVKEAASC